MKSNLVEGLPCSGIAGGGSGVMDRARRAVRSARRALAAVSARHASVRVLRRLSDRELADIGIPRADIERVVDGLIERGTGRTPVRKHPASFAPPGTGHAAAAACGRAA